MQLLIILFSILGILFIIVSIKLHKTSYSLRKLEATLKQVNEDRNMLLKRLLQDQEDTNKEKIAHISKSIFETNPSDALDFLEKMVNSPNKIVKANVVYALVQNLGPETLDMLLLLYEDTDVHVKSEVLKHLKELQTAIDTKRLTLNSQMANKIKATLAREKAKKEWII
jgi:HEAT repeat protein